MKKGDLIYKKIENDKWRVVKILEIDTWEDQSEVFHCLFYNPTQIEPTSSNRQELEVMAWHAPVDGTGYRENWNVLVSESVSDEELQGFYTYLKMTV